MKITNQNLEEMLVLVICVVIIPEVTCAPLFASLARLSHIGIWNDTYIRNEVYPPEVEKLLLERKQERKRTWDML
jgi:hypothetical protein